MLEKVKETLGEDGIKLVDKIFNELVEKQLIQPDNYKDAQEAALLAIVIAKNAMDVVEALPDYQQNRGAMIKLCLNGLSDSIKKFSAKFPEAGAVVSKLLQEFSDNINSVENIEFIVSIINDPERNEQHTKVIKSLVSTIGILGSLEREQQDVIDEALLFTKDFPPEKDEEQEAALASMMARYKDVVKFSSDESNAYTDAVNLTGALLERRTPEFDDKQKEELSNKVCVELLDRKKKAGLKLPRSKMMEAAIDLARQYRNAKESKSEIIEQVEKFKAELELIEKFLDKEKNPKQSAELEKVKAGMNRIIDQHNNKAYTLPKRLLRIFKRQQEDGKQKNVVQDGLLSRFKRKRGSADVSDREAASQKEGVSGEDEAAKKKRKEAEHPLKRRRVIAKRSGKSIDGDQTPAQDGSSPSAKK